MGKLYWGKMIGRSSIEKKIGKWNERKGIEMHEIV